MILVAGEALIDLTRAAPGDDGAGTYTAHPGGGPCNTAVALARLGVPTGFLGAVGTDSFGERLTEHLVGAGVDTAQVTRTDGPTTLALADVDDNGQASYAFYMDGTSAAQLYPRHVPDPLDDSIEAIHVGTLGLVLEPTGTSIVAMVVREAGRRVVAVDPNIRRAVIPDMEAHRARLDTVMRRADIVRVSVDDAAHLVPGADPEQVLADIGRLGVSLAVLTDGGDGVTALHRGRRIRRPAVAAEVVDTIGAGDSFNAGLLAWLHDHDRLTPSAIAALEPGEVAEAIDFAGAVAAVTVSRPGADPPHRTELEVA